jgi:hypothetical protein
VVLGIGVYSIIILCCRNREGGGREGKKERKSRKSGGSGGEGTEQDVGIYEFSGGEREKKGHLAADDEPAVVLGVVLGHLLEGVHLGRHGLRLPRESSAVQVRFVAACRLLHCLEGSDELASCFGLMEEWSRGPIMGHRSPTPTTSSPSSPSKLFLLCFEFGKILTSLWYG